MNPYLQRPCYRLSGGGNDFLAFARDEVVTEGEEPTTPPPDPGSIRAWCRRGLSLGADGVFLLTRRPGPPGSPTTVVMDYWNADGTAAELCLNGTRCAARLAWELGWVPDLEDPDEAPLTLLTGAGPFPARRLGPTTYELGLPPVTDHPREMELPIDDALARRCGVPSVLRGHLLSVGVPHLVLTWDGPMGEAPVAPLGPPLRRHEALGPPGANVDFVRWVGPDRFELRSFERGVEAETLACGTGLVATTTVGLLTGKITLPVDGLTLGGFTFGLDGELGEDGLPTRWTLAGDARLVAEGRIRGEAGGLPEPPSW